VETRRRMRRGADGAASMGVYRPPMAPNGLALEPIARRYAVLWSGPDGEATGRLEVLPDRFELTGRSTGFDIAFVDLVDATIGRGPGDRLRGLPVLRLLGRDGRSLRIAALEGAGVLYELAAYVGAIMA
jgi:hypothetical protein